MTRKEDNKGLDPPQLLRIYKDEIDCVGVDFTRFIGKGKNEEMNKGGTRNGQNNK